MGRRIYKFGSLASLAASATADLWAPGGDITWPADNAETTLVGTDAADAAGGTGAQLAVVDGIVKGSGPVYDRILEEVIPNGNGSRTLANQFWRVSRAYVKDVGSGGVNAAALDVKHGGTVLARIGAEEGQTLQAAYTVPMVQKRGLHLTGWKVTLTKGGNTAAIEVTLFARRPGESWRVLDRGGANSIGSFFENHWGRKVNYMAPGSDIRIRITDNTANATAIHGGFWLEE